MANEKKTNRVGKGYSCKQSTHNEIERRRKEMGLNNGGQVLDEVFKGGPENGAMPIRVDVFGERKNVRRPKEKA
jgi:hypothetical protein